MAFLSLRSQVHRFAAMAEERSVNGVIGHLHTADVTYNKLTVAALAVLREGTEKLGAPRLDDSQPITVTGREKPVPGLYFGSTAAVNNF